MVKKKVTRKKTVKKKIAGKGVAKKANKEPTWDEIGKLVGKKIEMASKEGKFNCKHWDRHNIKYTVKEKIQCGGTGGCFYFLGFIGSLVYYVTTAPSLWDAFLGFFKAIFWPAFLVYGVLHFIGV
ncbi:MAG: hypothetical protein JSV92_02510 [archaeon]|nr:MAG: hypothetical protein JSV92_02510 [archaeon]